MAITLAEASKQTQDALQSGVIDEFRKSNWILDNIIFDDCVSPSGGGTTMTYSYLRLKTQPNAEFREVNTEYSKSDVTKEKHSVDLKIFGGAYEIDRVIADMGGVVDEIALQQSQKIKAAQALFNDTFINGDSGVNSKSFDGLDKALTGSSTEFHSDGTIDLSTSDKITTNYMEFLDLMDEFILTLDGTPSFLGMNNKMVAKLRACARRASMYQVTKNDFGQQVEMYGNIPFIDLGAKPGSNDTVVGTDGSTGTTSIYAGVLGLDGLHAVGPSGSPIIKTWLPDFKTAGAVKTGEVEMLAAIALKRSKAAGVFRNIKVK